MQSMVIDDDRMFDVFDVLVDLLLLGGNSVFALGS